MRQAERRRAINKPIRTRSRSTVKDARVAIAEHADNAAEVVLTAVSALDRAASKGVIHKNAAARRKSRLMRRLNALQSGQLAAETKPVRGKGRTTKTATKTTKTAAKTTKTTKKR